MDSSTGVAQVYASGLILPLASFGYRARDSESTATVNPVLVPIRAAHPVREFLWLVNEDGKVIRRALRTSFAAATGSRSSMATSQNKFLPAVSSA